MKLKKWICAIILGVTFLSGCQSTSKTPGKIEPITALQLVEKVENKETFTLIFTQSWCPHCKTFLAAMEDYLPTHNVVLYEVVLDEEPNVDQSYKECTTLFPGLENGTPDLYYVENGEIKSRFWDDEAGKDGLSKDSFDAWAKTYDILGE